MSPWAETDLLLVENNPNDAELTLRALVADVGLYWLLLNEGPH